MSQTLNVTLWTAEDPLRRFLIPDNVNVAAGNLLIRTAMGKQRTVDEAAVKQYELTEEQARTWAKEQLGAVLGEIRGKALGYAERLRERTAEMREQNRKTWEKGVADAPPEVRELAETLRSRLRDLGRALRGVAKEKGATSRSSPAGNPHIEKRESKE